MMTLPTLRQLRYLVELVECRHFGKAAENCHVTQSTLSAGIQELEDLLGVRLLERTKRRVVATPLGLELAKRARRTIEEAEGLVEAAKAGAKPLTGRLHLGVIPTIGPYLLPKILLGLRRRFPELKLYLREDQTSRLLAQLAAGELDAAILALPMDLPNCRHLLLARDPFWLACPKTHPLAAKKSVRADEIPADELLLLEEGHCLREHALAACHLSADTGRKSFQGTSLHTLIEMVAGGMGVTLVPDMAATSQQMGGPNLAMRPLSDAQAARDIGLVWRNTSGRHEEFKLLGETLSALMTAANQ